MSSRKHHRSVVAVALLSLFLARSAYGRNEQIWFSQSADGSVQTNLSGSILYCEAALGGFIGVPQLTISGTQITIISTTITGECAPPPCLDRRHGEHLAGDTVDTIE